MTAAAGPSRPRLRLAVFGTSVAAAAVAGAVIGAPSRTGLEDSVESLGVAAPGAFVVIYAALTVGLIPGAALSVAAGALFGTALGSVVTVAGASIGAALAFWLARRLSRASMEAIAGKHLRRIDRRLADRGLLAMLVLRLVPLVPFNVLNYAAGATALGWRDYLVGTVVGIVPASVAFSAAGANAGDPASPAFVAALVVLALLTLAGGLAARRLRAGEP